MYAVYSMYDGSGDTCNFLEKERSCTVGGVVSISFNDFVFNEITYNKIQAISFSEGI